MNALLLAAYAWIAAWPGGAPPATPLDQRFPAPAGYRRVDVDDFGAWLRALPVRTDRADVRAYDGRPLDRPAAAVVALDVGAADLQQCADSLVRLRSEYLWQRGEADRAAWHFTSGDRSAWSDWRRGERFRVRGARVERVPHSAASSNSYATFRAWLTYVFQYAGTQSLPRDTTPVPADRPLQPGDLFVDPGSPGHAVMLLDVAEDAAGHRVALVGQGYMPAEDFHVLAADDVIDRVWFPLPDAARPALATPAWRPFPRAAARRFADEATSRR
jgi:hypothetical protein